MQGIYAIVNTVNGKTYIGSSSNIEQRWYGHRRDLRGGHHHSSVLQRAWNKYGEAAFVFQVMEVIKDIKDLFNAEQRWIDFLQTAKKDKGYNLNPYAMRGGWNARLTEEDATEIKRRRLSGESRKTIAEDFGITPNTVSKIVLGRRWAHLPGGRQQGSAKYKLAEADIPAIVKRLLNDENAYKITADYGVDPNVIHLLSRGRSWKHIGLPIVPRRRPGRKPRISKESAKEIKRRALAGERQSAIARDLDIDQSTVSRIAAGARQWAHLP